MRSVLVCRILVALALVGACAVCFGRLTLHPADILTGPQRDGQSDLTEYFIPLRTYQIETWRRYGSWPTWDSNLQLGRPTAGNPQSSLHYPVNWLYPLLGTPAIASWVMVAHHLFAGWGMYLLCRRHELNPIAAVTGAVTFLAAPYLVAQTAEGHYPQTCVAAWIPWILLAYERLRLGKKYSVPIMALVLALAFFCGHVQELYYMVVITSTFWVVDLIRQPPECLPRSDLALRWIGAGVLTAALVACEFGPVWVTTQEATRGQGDRSAAAAGGAGFANFQQLICPLALGTPDEMLQERREFYWETVISFGAIPLLLAVAAICLTVKEGLTVKYGILLAFCLVFALGDSTPVYTLLHKVVPGVSMFRLPSRIMFIASAAVGVMSAIAVHRLMTLPKSGSALTKAMPAVGIILAALVAAELCAYGWAVTATIPPSDYRTSSELTERLADSAGEYRVLIDQNLLGDGEAYRHNIAKARGYDPFYMVRHQAMLEAMIGNRQYLAAEVPGYATNEQLDYASGPVNLMGVRYAALAEGEPEDDAQWKLIAEGRVPARVHLRGTHNKKKPGTSYELYESQSALSRAFVLGHTEVARRGAAVIGQLSELDPRTSVLVTEDPLPQGQRQEFRPAKIVDFSPSRIEVEAELDADGILVLAETFTKGWTASVNGKDAEVIPVNVGFRGVALPPGKHQVIFAYDPPLRRVGLILTAIALVIVGLLLWNDFRPFDPDRAANSQSAGAPGDESESTPNAA